MKQQNVIILKIPAYPVTQGPNHHFFGYYDKCPWNASGSTMLSMEVNFIDRLPRSEDLAIIGVIDQYKYNGFKPVTETHTWNWQQGCMLQWLPPDYDRNIIYNDRQNDRLISITMDIETKRKTTLPIPIYSVHPEGRYAATLNFARLNCVRRGYGYEGGAEKFMNEAAPEKDGIYLLDIKTGMYKLIISIAKLYSYNHISSMEDGMHWVDHLMFNLDGSRLSFLHRWHCSDGGIYSRLFTANLDGSNMYCLLDSGNFSHYSWKNCNELLGWGRLPNKLNQIRKNKWMVQNVLTFILPFYRKILSDKSIVRRKIANDSYLLFSLQTKQVKKIGVGLLNEDGHCSSSPDEKWILTDTYPDKNHFRTLLLYHYEKEIKIEIGKYYSLPHEVNDDWEISSMRCDLHPRWNRDGTRICFDSVHEGSRQIYVLDIRDILYIYN